MRPAARGHHLLITLTGIAALLAASTATAANIEVAWRPVAGAAGYRLYVRQSGQAYDAGMDVGSPAADIDGVIRYIRVGLPSGITHVFAVSAYDAALVESLRSNELSLTVAATPTYTVPPTPPRTSTPVPTSTHTFTPAFTATRTPAWAPSTPTASPTRTSVPGYDVIGRIWHYAGGAPVANAAVRLQGPGSMIQSTDSAGVFRFSNVSPGTWQLEPDKTGDRRGAVSALDAAYVLQTVSGSRNLTAVEQSACDVTGNGALSALDATRILQFAVGLIDHFPAAEQCASDWLFVPQPPQPLGTMVPPLLAGGSCRPGALRFEPLLNSATEQNFLATVLGDCTGNWQAAGSGAALRQLGAPPRLRLGEALARPGRRWLVPLYVEGPTMLDALEARLSHGVDGPELTDVELIGDTAGTLVSYRPTASGEIVLAVATAEPLHVGQRPIAVLSFSGIDAPSVSLLEGAVNETPAEIE